MSKEFSESVIGKSFVERQENWSGKEFSESPAKIYNSFLDCVEALNNYWFSDTGNVNTQHDQRRITIIHLTEKQKQKLLREDKIRY